MTRMKTGILSYFICVALISLHLQGTEGRNCGTSPNFVHLSRGEKRRIEFWSNEKEDGAIDSKFSPESAALRFSASDPAEIPENRDVVKADEAPVNESTDFLPQVESRVDKPQADSLTFNNVVEKNANDSQVVPTADLVNHESHEDISVTTEVSIDQTEAPLQRDINKQTLHIDFQIKETGKSDIATIPQPDSDIEFTESTLTDLNLRSSVEDSAKKLEETEFSEKSSPTEVPENVTLGNFQESSDQEGFTETSNSIIGEGKHASNQDGLPATTDSDVPSVTEVPEQISFKFSPVVLSEDVIQDDKSSPSFSADFAPKHSEETKNEDHILARTVIGSTEDSTERAVQGVNNDESFTNEIELTNEGDVATEQAITREDQVWQGPDFAASTEAAPLDVAQDTTETNFLDSQERNLQGTETGTESVLATEEDQTEVNFLGDPEDLRFDVPTELPILEGDSETNMVSDSSTEPPAESIIEKLIQSSPLSEDRIWQGTNLGTPKGSTELDVHGADPTASSTAQPEHISKDQISPGTENDGKTSSEDQISRETVIVSPNLKNTSGSDQTLNIQSVLSEDQTLQGTEIGSSNVDNSAGGAGEKLISQSVLTEDQLSQGNDFVGLNSNSVSSSVEDIPQVTEPSLAQEDVTEIIETKSPAKNTVQDSVMSVMIGAQAQSHVAMPTNATVENTSHKENDSDAENAEPKDNPSNEDILFHLKNIISTFSRRDDSIEVKNITTRNKFFGLERFFLRRNKRAKPVDPFFEIPAPDLSSAPHDKKLTREQEQLYHSFVKESGSHMIHEEDKIEVKDDVVDVKVTGVLPFGPSVGQPTKVRGTVDTVVGTMKPPRWRRGEESWLSRLKSSLARFMESRPLPLRRALLLGTNGRNSKTFVEEKKETTECDWKIKTDPGLYLLVTFHNLSAPYTLDCQGAYIEVEREANGFEARWCGNKIGQQRGTRSHVIFARSEVRISVFDDGTEGKAWPTGFSAEAEVIDLHDAGHYSSFRRSDGYSSVSRLMG